MIEHRTSGLAQRAAVDADISGRRIPALQSAPNHQLACRIHAMDLKHRFRDVETYCRDRLHARLPQNHERPSGDRFNGTCMPREESSTAS